MSFQSWRGGLRGARLWNPARLQWAPTLTAHDPNPPINLESPAGASPQTLAATACTITLTAAVAALSTSVLLAAGGNGVTLTAPDATLLVGGGGASPTVMLFGGD